MSENISPASVRKRQLQVLGVLAGLGLAIFLAINYFGNSSSNKPRPPEPEKLKIQPPGQVDERMAWRGQAEGDIKNLKDGQKGQEARLTKLEELLKQKNPDATGPAGLTTPPPDPQKTETKEPKLGQDKQYSENEKSKLKDIRSKDKQSEAPAAEHGNFRYPPGNPNESQDNGMAPVARKLEFIDVSTKAAGDIPSGNNDKSATGAKPASRRKTVDNYLSIGHIPIVLLGGLNAPTGGQSQNNSLPIYFRVMDDGYLANRFRSRVKECLGVGTGYGDLSAERAILRTETLSCVLEDGTIVETSIKGTIFGSDGMVGIHGKVVTKTGQMLANAALAGVSSGIGHAFQQSSMTQSVSALGTTSTVDSGKQFQAGIGTGIGNALDRLSQYWIRLADKTFPVVEVQAGVTGDLVIQKGSYIDLPTSGDDNLSELDKRNQRMNRYGED